MAILKYVEKLDKYYARLDSGKARKIKPDHVLKVIKKLEAKENALVKDEKQAVKDTKRARLQRKQLVVQEQVKRAKWLLKQIKVSTD